MKSLFGILVAILTLLIVTMLGGPLYLLVNVKSALLVFGILLAVTLIANKQSDILKIIRKEQIENYKVQDLLNLLKNTLKGTIAIAFFISSIQLAYDYVDIKSLGNPLVFLLSTGFYSTLLIVLIINPLEIRIKN